MVGYTSSLIIVLSKLYLVNSVKLSTVYISVLNAWGLNFNNSDALPHENPLKQTDRTK
jgi:hypothetical protein